MRSTLVLITMLVSLAFAAPATAAELDARLNEMRIIGPSLRVSIDLQDVFSDKFRQILEGGGRLHVRIEVELWEDRPLWDKLVRPAIVSMFRIFRDPNAQISVADAVGVVVSLPWSATEVPLRLDAGPAEGIHEDRRYYLRLVATVGTLEEREVASTSDAVFGRGESAVSVARLGKLIFNTVLQVNEYLQSVSTEVKSPVFVGRDLKTRR